MASSLWIYPHSLSYFNELVGGPRGGPNHLGAWGDSNFDWGQDLLYLKRWLERHPEAELAGLAFNGAYDAWMVGILAPPPPPGPEVQGNAARRGGGRVGPMPGWYALSINRVCSRTPEYVYFSRFQPVATAGYTINVYHVTLEDANRVRREYALADLSAPGFDKQEAPRNGE